MTEKPIFVLVLFSMFIVFLSRVPLHAQEYRLCVARGYTGQTYEKLFKSLAQKGMVQGENLAIVLIELEGFRSREGKKKIRQEISEKCDLFFTIGDNLGVLNQVQPKSPLLFTGSVNPAHKIPKLMEKTATGFYWGSISERFERIIRLLPEGQQKKLGMIYFKGSRLSTLTPDFKKICKKLGVELIAKEYLGKDGIKEVMHKFKEQGVGGVTVFTPAIHAKDELMEIINWQNKLNLPVIGQNRKHIEMGVLGGPAIDYRGYLPLLSEYCFKLLSGRNPSQFPIKYLNRKYVINLSTASSLGIKLPREIVSQADIIGRFDKNNDALDGRDGKIQLVPGSFSVGIAENIILDIEKLLFKELSLKGYVEGKNLKITRIKFTDLKDSEEKQQILRQVDDVDLIFATCNVLQLLSSLDNFNTPVCFLTAARDTSLILSPWLRKNSTGVTSSSIVSIFKISQQMMSGANRIAILSNSALNQEKQINHFLKLVSHLDYHIDFRIYDSNDQIGRLMQEMKKNNDFLLLFPAPLKDSELNEFVRWQNKLKFPVISQVRSHIKAGFLGGAVIDNRKVAPKLAEYIDKILQGRPAFKLPVYHYQEKIIINLNTARGLRIKIPAKIMVQSEIVRHRP
jgi:putative tryptophan/tyrosine transport system substrate-binding protein